MMNRMKFVSLFICASCYLVQANQVEANSNTTSNLELSFVPGTEEMPPLNPENPDQERSDNVRSTGMETGAPIRFDTVTTIKFDKPQKSSKNRIYDAVNKFVVIQLTDNRGSNSGWNVSAKLSELKNDSGEILKGASLMMHDGVIRTTANNPSERPKEYDTVFNNSEINIIMKADANAGRGTWLDVYEAKKDRSRNQFVQLEVLGSTSEETGYQATMEWQITDVPK